MSEISNNYEQQVVYVQQSVQQQNTVNQNNVQNNDESIFTGYIQDSSQISISSELTNSSVVKAEFKLDKSKNPDENAQAYADTYGVSLDEAKTILGSIYGDPLTGQGAFQLNEAKTPDENAQAYADTYGVSLDEAKTILGSIYGDPKEMEGASKEFRFDERKTPDENAQAYADVYNVTLNEAKEKLVELYGEPEKNCEYRQLETADGRTFNIGPKDKGVMGQRPDHPRNINEGRFGKQELPNLVGFDSEDKYGRQELPNISKMGPSAFEFLRPEHRATNF